MATPRLAKLELQIMEVLWSRDAASIREIVDALPGKKKRSAYTTIQTTLYRMEDKGAVRRLGRVVNFDVFTASVSRESAQRRLIDELLDLLGGSAQPIMSHLIDTGKLLGAGHQGSREGLAGAVTKRGAAMNPDFASVLLRHLEQSTVVAVAAWLLTAALRRNRAAVRHGVWFAASMKFLLPLDPLIRVGMRTAERFQTTVGLAFKSADLSGSIGKMN